MDDQMAAWMKYAQPTEQHEFLKRLAGSWKGSGKFWMQPDQPPMETGGTSENRMVLGGRFLESRYTSEMMGQPFEGMALDGYDILNGKYVGVWLDSMGTMMLQFEGTVSGNTREMFAGYTNPMDGKPTRMKGVTTILDENTHRYEGWNEGPDGEFFKTMEIVYTRA